MKSQTTAIERAERAVILAAKAWHGVDWSWPGDVKGPVQERLTQAVGRLLKAEKKAKDKQSRELEEWVREIKAGNHRATGGQK